MKIFVKILLGLFAFLIILIGIMKLFFPIFRIAPAFEFQDGMIIDARYVLTQKYFSDEKLTHDDFIVYSSIPGRYDDLIVLRYQSDFYDKYKDFSLGKVIFQIK